MNASPEGSSRMPCLDERADRQLAILGRHKAPLRLADSHDSQASGAPEPLRRPTAPPETYPIADLGPILGPACESLHRVIRAPAAICGASVLAAASLAAQGLADVVNQDRSHPISLWMLSVASSGERKSAVDAEAMRPIREHERALVDAYGTSLAAHEAELEEWNARREKAKNDTRKAGGVGLAAALEQIGIAPDAPLLPKLIVGDFTAEGLAKLLRVGLPSVGAFTDEAALVFGGHGMTKETVMRTAATLSKLWDRGELDRVRGGDGAVKLFGRRFALHLMAQPVIAERALSDDVLTGQGFLARCLLSWPESTAGHRLLVLESLREDPAMVMFRTRVTDLLRLPLPMAAGKRNELAPRALPLAPEAFAKWRLIHDAIETQLAAEGRYAGEIARASGSKTPEQCLRIAGVLTLLEDPDAPRIEAITLERAAELALWHLNEATRLAGTAELSAEVRDAEALLTWCHATKRTILHSGAALRLGPARIRERARFMEAMRELERAGWARPVEGGMELDGAHRRHVWQVVAADAEN